MKKFTTAIATVLALILIFATSARAESPKPVDRVETCVVVDTVFDGYEWDVSIEDMQGNIWKFIDRENFWEVGMEGSFWFNDNATPNDFTDDEMEGLYHETHCETITVTERYYNGSEWLIFAKGSDGNVWCMSAESYKVGDKLRVTFDDYGTPSFPDDDAILMVEKV